jgi:hypothetical protein
MGALADLAGAAVHLITARKDAGENRGAARILLVSLSLLFAAAALAAMFWD